MKKLLIFLLAAALVLTLSSCTPAADQSISEQRWSASFIDLFDTVTTIVGFSASRETFSETAQNIHDTLLSYHQYYDIYNSYDGIANLKTINDNAGIEPVKVDRKIIDLLLFCRDMCEKTNGSVDITMGAVLRIWHNARNNGIDDPDNAALPDISTLEEALTHTGFDKLIIDEEAGTVFLTDPAASLDAGCVAKGYAAEQLRSALQPGLLVSVGGNVISTGISEGHDPWTVAIQDPDGTGSDYLHIVYLSDASSIVTSGDYQRYYTVDGKRYCHIISPYTLFPPERWRAVTILCENSAVADILSTALFILPEDEGRKLIDEYHAEAAWVDPSGEIITTPGYKDRIK